MISITSVRHSWPNPPGFYLSRSKGHPDYTFVHFITSVKLHLNGKIVIAPDHACIIYKPSTPQYFTCPDGMIHDWIHFSGVSEQLFDDLDIPTDELIFPKQWSFITDIIEEIENEFFARRDHNERLMDLKVNEMLIRLSRALKGDYSETIDQKFTSDLRQLRTNIAQNLSHSWTIAEMANKLMLSQSRFAHLYHSFYGISPIDDLIHMRISAAQNALTFTESSIHEIAYSLGYRNITHFSRQFRQSTGLSPSQYRKNTVDSETVGISDIDLSK